MGSLTEEQKAEVVRRYHRGETQAKLARDMETSRHTIRAALDEKGARVVRARGIAEARRTVEMPADLLAQLEEVAGRKGKSVNLEIVDALRAHAEKNLSDPS